jgi:hypothetical protein
MDKALVSRFGPLLRHVIEIMLTAVFFTTVGLGVFIHIHYADTMPRSPQPEAGRINRMMVNHGYIVYVTDDELRRANDILNGWIHDVGTTSFFLLVAVELRWRLLKSIGKTGTGGWPT